MAGGKQSAHKIKLEERRMLALELRLNGVSYRDIARTIRERLNLRSYSAAAAYRDVSKYLHNVRAKCTETAEQILQMELMRLNAMRAAIAPRVAEGDLAAVDRELRIMEREAALLGLDAPKRHMLDGEVQGTFEIKIVPTEDAKPAD